mmetsp:Transcript_46563/g.113412  ORF Transcript_46563/g.113412 Transcript_46563/m.113412 type:complete len:740 (-) Transcript_46563:422-2641(-)
MVPETLEVSQQSQPTAQLETPIILTRNLIPGLTKGLDASDALECYALVRSAPLHGIANSTVSVHKMAIGIRYRPKGGGADLSLPHAKPPVEMTLEYGPLRVGPLLNDESMPIVQVEESTSYLSWDNVGKVYFTRKIVKEHFLSSYYMASITGAVLDQLLTEAVDYTERHKAYQPFSVYSEEKGRLLRSSSSTDFVWYIWAHLAKLGVQVNPILPPPVYEARLHVKSVSKVIPEAPVAHQAALFYQKLYNCLEAIATNNYGSFVQKSSDDDRDGNDRRRLGSSSSEGTVRRAQNSSSAPTLDPSSEVDISSVNETLSPTPPPSIQEDITPEPSSEDDEFLAEDEEVDQNDEDSENDTQNQEESPGIDNDDASGEGVEKTQQAANEAQKAAEEAKEAAETEGQTKTADAAQAAADAAQAAADATSEAASKVAMDNILSGDGSMMSSIITACLSNPKYEIAVAGDNGTIVTDAYLYRDSSFYYKLELTSPYLSVVKLNRGLPRAVLLSDFGAGGDAVDWMIALTIGFSVLFMVLLICQQMGNNWVGSIFRCQRWYFNPRKHDYEGDAMHGVQSGALFFFGESGIPLSMGGKRSSYSPVGQQDTLQNVMAEVHENDENVLYPPLSSQMARRTRTMSDSSMELEMSELNNEQLQREKSNTSLASEDDSVDVVPERLLRDPGLVELPSLKSKSRVAVPVGSSNTPAGSSNSQHRSNSFVDDASASSFHSRSSSHGESPFAEATFL